MKFTIILVTTLIYLLNPLFTKSEEIDSLSVKKENALKEEPLNNKTSTIETIHIVKVGETISSISKLYSIDKKLIITLNGLKDENYIYLGQNLIISNAKGNSSEKTNLTIQQKNAYHIVQAGENLTDISNKYRLEVQDLIDINQLSNPDSIKEGMKLLLSENEDNQLINIAKKTYGPLTIQSKRFEELNGRQIINVLNQKDKKLILSIKCETEELDVRIPGRMWRGFQPAQKKFEKNLINDIC